MANTIDHNHGSTGASPSSGLDFSTGDFPDPEVFDWFWNQTVTTVNDHAAQLDAIDSDGDGKVDAAETADSAATVKGNDIDSDGDGKVDAADTADSAQQVKGNDIDTDGDGIVDEADSATTAAQTENTTPFLVRNDIEAESSGSTIYDESQNEVPEEVLPDIGGSDGHTVDYFQKDRPSGAEPLGATWVEPLGLETYWSASELGASSGPVTAQGFLIGAGEGTTIGRVSDDGGAGYSIDWTNSTHHNADVIGVAIAEDPDNFVHYLMSIDEADGRVVSTVLREAEGGSFGSPGDQNWTHTDHSGEGAAIAADGTLTVSVGSDGNAIAYDPVSGTQQWSTQPHNGDSIQGVALTSEYAVTMDYNNGDIVAVDRADGSEFSTIDTIHSGGIAVCSVPTADTDVTYSAGGDGTIAKIDWTGTGSAVWTESLSGPSSEFFGDIYTNPNEDLVYAIYFNEEKLYALDKTTGSVEWEADVASGQSSVAVSNNSVLVSGNTLSGKSMNPTARQWIHNGETWFRLRE